MIAKSEKWYRGICLYIYSKLFICERGGVDHKSTVWEMRASVILYTANGDAKN